TAPGLTTQKYTRVSACPVSGYCATEGTAVQMAVMAHPRRKSRPQQVLEHLGRHRQPPYNLLRYRVSPRGNLLRGLVLDGMLHVDRIKAGAAERTGLHARRSAEFRSCHRNSGDAQVFQLNRIVQTARGA